MKRTYRTKNTKKGVRVEFLLAHEDGTWTTEVMDTSLTQQDESKAVAWANQNCAGKDAYRKIVLFAVYGFPAQEEQAF